MGNFIDLTGQKFGRITVLKLNGSRSTSNKPFWDCVCDCGTHFKTISDSLRGGLSKSCGCLRKERGLSIRTTHGLTTTRKYARECSAWYDMIQRCNNPDLSNYAYYGGRGISVCNRWLESFENFFKDMGPKPKGGRWGLDRIDNNKGYYKANCRWASDTQQARNTRGNVLVTLNGETKCVAEWCEIKVLRRGTFENRRKLGWSIEKALTTPIRRRGNKND